MTERMLTGGQAVREALDQAMEKDETVFLMGLGVDDPKGIFGTTAGLAQKYGPRRVLEPPVAENSMTGIAIGAAITGMRPVLVHQRIDFAILSMDQIINNAAKWHYMFGGATKVPLTIRMIIGRGWGQGPQHSQSLQAIFMHIPGLKVVMPFNPYDTKGLLMASIADDNPVIFIEHRWLQNIQGPVPDEPYQIPLGKAKTVRKGKDLTIVTISHMVLESLKAADVLEKIGISVEVVDLRTIKPLDIEHILKSVKKTGRLIAVDTGYLTGGLASEICALVSENSFYDLKAPVRRITLPDYPAPTSQALIQYYYPTATSIVDAVLEVMRLDITPKQRELLRIKSNLPCDVPDSSFKGPF